VAIKRMGILITKKRPSLTSHPARILSLRSRLILFCTSPRSRQLAEGVQ